MIRQRLAHLIAALEAPCVLEVLEAHENPATTKYLRQLRMALNMDEGTSATECFAKLARKARKFDKKLANAGFPEPHPVFIRCRHDAEATMTFLSPTYLGGASETDKRLLTVKGIQGFEKLLDRVAKARNYLGLIRYLVGDLHASPRRGDYLAAKTIDLLMPSLTDYWADLVIVDRDAIVEKSTRGDTMWIWVRENGWGTWVSTKSRDVPADAIAVVRVGPDGPKLMRRAKNTTELAA